MERTEARTLAERAVAAALAAGADAAEAILDHSALLEVSISNHDLDQVKVAEEAMVGLRVVCDGRMGFATSNRTAAVADLAGEAVAIARASPPDPHAGLPGAAPLAEAPDALDPALLQLDAAGLARIAVDWLDRIGHADDRVVVDSAELSVERGARAIASSSGVSAAWRSASASGQVFGMAVTPDGPGSFSYDGAAVRRLADFDAAMGQAVQRFVDGCVGALDPQRGESFRGPVLIPPRALASFLLGPLLSACSAKSVRLGTSPLADKVGERIASPGFTLWDCGAGIDGFALAPFDREGLPRRRRAIVEDGVLGGFLFDSREARAAGAASTGNAQGGASGPPYVGLASLSLDPGDQTAAALEAGLDRAVLVTRFAGSTDPVSGDFSGVVKGGFLLRKGARVPIHETTIAGNVWRCLQSIRAVSSDRLDLDGQSRLPWLVVDDLSITSA